MNSDFPNMLKAIHIPGEIIASRGDDFALGLCLNLGLVFAELWNSATHCSLCISRSLSLRQNWEMASIAWSFAVEMIFPQESPS